MSLEGGTPYEDAIWPQEIAAERDDERRALWGAENQETQGGERESQESSEHNENIDTKVQEFLEKFAKLAESQWLDWYDIFERFIQNSSEDIQKSFIDRTNVRNLKNVVEESWRFPVNDFELQQTFIEWTILGDTEAKESDTAAKESDTAAKESDTAEKIIDAQKALQTLENFRNSLSWIQLSDSNLISILNAISGVDSKVEDKAQVENIKELSSQLISALQNSKDIEKTILPQAKQSGNYETVKASLIELGGGENWQWGLFAERIAKWELGEKYEYENLPPEEKVRVSGATGVRIDEVDSNTDKSGNIFSITTDDGFDVDYDVVSDTRSLSLDGYTLSSQVQDQGNYEAPKLAYMQVEQEHKPFLEKIQKAIQAINDKEVWDDEIAEIKETLRQELGWEYSLWWIDSLDDASDIKKLLNEKYQEHQEPLKQAREEYKDTLLSLRNGYFAALEKRDRKTKEVLNFLQDIWVTYIPQHILDPAVNTLNSQPGLRRQVGFTEKIDFANGQLGTDSTLAGESIDTKIPLIDKKVFAQIFNKMIWVTDAYWNPPIDVDAIGRNLSPIAWQNWEDPQIRMQTLIAESGILLGGPAKIIENLQKTDEEDNKISPQVKNR